MSQTALQQTSSHNEVAILRSNVNDLQRQLQIAYERIGELVEERDTLRCKIIDTIKR